MAVIFASEYFLIGWELVNQEVQLRPSKPRESHSLTKGISVPKGSPWYRFALPIVSKRLRWVLNNFLRYSNIMIAVWNDQNWVECLVYGVTEKGKLKDVIHTIAGNYCEGLESCNPFLVTFEVLSVKFCHFSSYFFFLCWVITGNTNNVWCIFLFHEDLTPLPLKKKKNSRSRTLAHLLFTLHDPRAFCWLCFNFRCVYEIGGNWKWRID